MIYLHVTFSDGSQWRIPAEIIAMDRAKYYANLDFERGDVDDLDKALDAEYRFAMEDDHELLDWANNNMDWEDVAAHVERVETRIPAFHDEWSNAEKTIIRD